MLPIVRVLAVLAVLGSSAAAQPVTLTVDASDRNQTLFGFGASVSSLVYGSNDYLSAPQRASALRAAFSEVGINTGLVRLAAEFTANDNDDPFLVREATLDWTYSDNAIDGVLVPGVPLGFEDAFPAFKISQGYAHAWMIPLRSNDYETYLDECAENALISVRYWQKRMGEAPRLLQLFNEPTTGNKELRLSNAPILGADPQEVVDIVKRAGARLAAEGYPGVRFVVPAEATPAKALATARLLYDDPGARPFVGALAYHAYPYGSAYASPARILAESGAGRPDPDEVAVRRALRELAARFGVPLLMNEVSEGPGNQDYPYGAPETVRARALHVHDELRYAGAAGYFGMNLMWDRRSHVDHFGNADYRDEEDTIVLVGDGPEAEITGMGYAIGHYARWTSRGAVRLGSTSSDDRVRLTALYDPEADRLVLVLINNRPEAVEVDVSVRSGAVSGDVDGEASYGTVRWGPAPSVEAADGHLRATLPPESVVTYASAFATSVSSEGSPEQSGLRLEAPFPNPTSGRARVAYTLPQSEVVRVSIHDTLGRVVAVVADGRVGSGRHEAVIPAGLSPGVYTVRASTEGNQATTRLTVL